MHTLEAIEAGDISYEVDGQPVARDEVLPPISVASRVGVVMGDGAGGLGAGNFVLASVIGFYDSLGRLKTDFFEYPDFYTSQASANPADYQMLDVYPDHKNVAVDPSAESILRAVNDRAVDVLLVPNRSPGTPDIEDVTRRSAERRIESCFLYSPSGRLDGDGFTITVPRSPVEDWYETTANSTTVTTDVEGWRTDLGRPGRISQQFRQLPLDRALEHLPTSEGQ